MSVNRLSKFKKKVTEAELSEEERKKQYENYLAYVSDCTDRVICQYLCTINGYSITDVFPDVSTKIAGMSFEGSTNKYEIKFAVISDEKKYSITKPTDVKPEVFKELINHMDTSMRMDIVFKKRLAQYLQYQNSRKNPPKVELIEGCKIFLRSDKNLYYIGNKFMSDEHIAFVEKMRALPISIGFAISTV